MIDPTTVPAMDDADENLFDGDPIPLTQTVQIPAFPTDALPNPIADMVNTVSEATQTDPAMAGTSALSALSACTGGHAEIEIRGGWREPLNLYTAAIAGPGERKSSVQHACQT
jgi:replicative DNA helicase